jgi:hypothetical protein
MVGRQPLFAPESRSSTGSDEQFAREEDALLGNHQRSTANNVPTSRATLWREIGLFTWAVLATATAIVLAVLFQHQAQAGHGTTKPTAGKRNLVFMVSDGSMYFQVIIFRLGLTPQFCSVVVIFSLSTIIANSLSLQWDRPAFHLLEAFVSTKKVYLSTIL